MTIVSNASPLINLARIGKLDLLRQLYGEVLVPQAVWQEVVLDGAERPGADEVKTSTWIQMRTIGDQRLAQALRQELGAGEAEAIDPRFDVFALIAGRQQAHGRTPHFSDDGVRFQFSGEPSASARRS